MPTKLYFIASTSSGDGANMDLFVSANCPENAVERWKEFYEGWDADPEDVRVWEVPERTPVEGAHPWKDPVLDTGKVSV